MHEGRWEGSNLPKKGIYLKRASHDLSWSCPFILEWGLCVHVCLCACMLTVGDLQIFLTAVSPENRTALPPMAHKTNLTDSLVQLLAKKLPTSTKSKIPAEVSYLPWDDRGEAAVPTLFPGKCWTAVSLSASLSVCMLFVGTTLLGLHFSGLSWIWQFDKLSRQNTIAGWHCHITLLQALFLNFCPWCFIFSVYKLHIHLKGFLLYKGNSKGKRKWFMILEEVMLI